MTEPAELDLDICDRRGRLRRLAIAAAIGAIGTFFMLTSMINSGRGPSADPVGQTSVVMMGVLMFALSTSTAHKFITKITKQRKTMKARARI